MEAGVRRFEQPDSSQQFRNGHEGGAAMHGKPTITFRATVATKADPGRVYALLADLPTHLIWNGEQAVDRNFRLLSLEAPAGEAAPGTQFSSTGSNILSMRFVDRSVVVEALPGTAFVFDTTSELHRKHRPTWHARFVHRYHLDRSGGGTTVAYTCEVWPKNYVPWWLKPPLRPMMRVSVARAIRRNMRNLAAMAEIESARATQGGR